MNNNVPIPFSLSSLIPDEYWIKLEQAEIKETATVGEVAELVDAIFEIDSCDPEIAAEEEEEEIIEETEPESLVDLVHLSDTIKELFELQTCSDNSEGDFAVQVKVIVSTIGAEYTLRPENGRVTKTTTTVEEIDDHLTIEDVSGIVLEYPVKSFVSAEWNSKPISSSGPIGKPEITLTGNTLNWGISVTGSITVKYTTQYDIVDLVVFGTEEAELGDCTLLGFYHGLIDILDIEQPTDTGDYEDQENYCDYSEGSSSLEVTRPPATPPWVTTRTEYKCVCSGKHAYYVHSKPPTTAQRISGSWTFPGITKKVFGDYVGCDEPPWNGSKIEFYIENCCTYPPFVLPNCRTYYRKNGGGQKPDADTLARLNATYGKQLRLIPVTPADGDCGRTKYTQKLRAKNCCEDVDPMTWDEEWSPTVVPGYFHILGGKAPFDIRVSGDGFSLDPESLVTRIEIDDGWFWVYLMPGACGSGQITVEDACEQGLTKGIRAPEGVWADLGGVGDYDGCSTREGCCAGAIGVCNIGEPPETGQCYDYYSGGIGYRAEYLSGWEEESEGYKLVRVDCASYRNCVSYTCYAGACSKTEPISGIEYEAVIANPCIEGYGNTVGYNLYEWSCDE